VDFGREDDSRLTSRLLRVLRRAFRGAFETIATVMTVQRQTMQLCYYETSTHQWPSTTESGLDSRDAQFLEESSPQSHSSLYTSATKYDFTTRFSTKPDPSKVYSYLQDPFSIPPYPHHAPLFHPSLSPPPRSRHKQPSSIQPSGYPTFKELVATSLLPLQPPVVVARRTDCAVDERTTCLLMSCDARASR
jgi:hypothetical protein